MEKIIIKNFGPIKNIEFNLDKQFNVVIGEQATGKSTLAKCIYFFKDAISVMSRMLVAQSEKLMNMTAENILQVYYISVKNLFYISFGRYTYNENSKIYYYYSIERYVEVFVNNGEIQFRYDENTESEIIKILNTYIKKQKTKVHNDDLFNLRVWGIFIERLFGNEEKRMFIPACRSRVSTIFDTYLANTNDVYLNILLENISMFKFFMETYSKTDIDVNYLHKENVPFDLHERFADLNLLKRRILKGDYESDKDKTWIKLENGLKVPVEYGSSGQQESLWILNFLTMIMYSANRRFLIIEEPEAHLYPSAQFELVKLIALVINTTDSKVMITTHSPYILSAFNILTYAGQVEKNNKDGIISLSQRIKPQSLSAFKLERGLCRNIYNEKEGLITSEEIDTVSTEMNTLFDKLIDKSCEEMR